MKKINLNAPSVETVEEYFNLPLEEREERGWYIEPSHIIRDFGKGSFDEMMKFYEDLHKELKRRYPIQFRVREGWDDFSRWLKILKFSIEKPFLNYHKEIRAKIPKREWSDIASLIEDVNFQFVLSYYEECINLYPKHFEVWRNETDPTQQGWREFFVWLEEARRIILEEFPKQESEKSKDIDLYLNNHIDTEESMRRDKERDDFKTKLLKEIVEKRDYFWT